MVSQTRLAILTMVSGAAFLTATAHADYISKTETQTVKLAPTNLDSSFPAVTFNQFTPTATTTLTGVEIQVDGRSWGDFTITYNGTGQTTYTGLLSGELQVTVPERTNFLAPLVIQDAKTIGSGSFTATGDTGTLSQTYNYTTAADLAMFQGTGTFSVPVNVFSVPQTIGDKSGALLFTSTNANGSILPHFQADATVTITYQYNQFIGPPIPEPASLALMGLGVTGLGVLGTRRRRAAGRLVK